jgi:hypothetical protein
MSTKIRSISWNSPFNDDVNGTRLPVAKFLVPEWGEIVDPGIGLLHLPARLHRLAGRYDKSYGGVDYIPPVRD